MINCVVDISHHNGSKIDFQKMKANGIAGIIHKATSGLKLRDPLYITNKIKALDAGLLWGAYHWGDGIEHTANDQAKYFLDFVKPDAHTLLALDYEPNEVGGHKLGPDMNMHQAEFFVNTIKQETGRYPLFYTGAAMLGRIPPLPECPLWWAGYTRTDAPKKIPQHWGTWTLWQYTDGVWGNGPHEVDGIGLCDRSKFNGDINQLRELWGFTVK